VVIVHFFCVFFPFAVFGVQGSYQQHRAWETLFYSPPLATLIAGYSAVCVFFILSGYVLSFQFLGVPGTSARLLAAMVKRPIRLGGLVLVTVLIGALIWSTGLGGTADLAEITSSKPYFSEVWSGRFNASFAARQISTNLFDIARLYNNPLWTIATELEGSLLVYAFLLLFGACRYRIVLMVLLIACFRNHEYQNFLFGMMMADLVKHGTCVSWHRFRPLATVLLLPLALYFFSYPNFTDPQTLARTWYGWLPRFTFLGGSGYCGYPTLGAMLLFVLVCITPAIQGLLRHPLPRYIGSISYSIYATHFLVLGTFSAWLFPHLLTRMGYSGAVFLDFLVSVALIIPLAHGATILIDNQATRLSSWVGSQVVFAIAKIEDLV